MAFCYLKDEQHYIDLYDLHTIERCLDYYWALKDGFAKDRAKFKDYTDEQFNKEVHKCTSYVVNVIKGERYRNKASSIKEWMDRDRLMQDKIDNTPPPEDVLCKKCSSSTKLTSKDLMDSYSDNARVVFMYECLKCKKRQALYEDRTEWIYHPPLCPKCNTPFKSKSTHTKHTLKTIYTCPNCKHVNTFFDDFKKSEADRKKGEEREKKLLAEYRSVFVYTEKEGQEYINTMTQLQAFSERQKEKEAKEKDPNYQKAMQLKKLKVHELEKLLSDTLGKQQYVKLMLDKPEINQYVIIPFTVQDSNEKRNERESSYELNRIIKKTLKDTNWRLMTEGVSYRLGYLSGRLKGYEREDDLISLVKSMKQL